MQAWLGETQFSQEGQFDDLIALGWTIYLHVGSQELERDQVCVVSWKGVCCTSIYTCENMSPLHALFSRLDLCVYVRSSTVGPK